MTNLMQSVKDNLAFLGVCLVIVVAIFVVAGLTEKALRQKKFHGSNQFPGSSGGTGWRIFGDCGGTDAF